MNDKININYAEMIGEREVQLEALRIVIKQKDVRIAELETRLNTLLEKAQVKDEE